MAGGLALSEAAETQDLEALGAALNRACGVLAAVGDLYSPHEDVFSGGNGFVAHAVTTAHGLLVEANYALSALYAKLLERAAQDAQAAANRAALEELADERVQSAASAMVPDQAQTSHAEPAEDDAVAEGVTMTWPAAARREHHGAAGAESQPPQEGFAKTFQELLQRVTAVEVFAKDQDMQASPEAQKKLLPLVEGLREELKKLSQVA